MDEFEEALAEACTASLSVAAARGDATAVRVIKAVRDPMNRVSTERLAHAVLEAVTPNA